MADHPEALNHMFAAWNETDPARVRGHLDKALSQTIRFVDPSIDLSGIDAFEANVHKVHTTLPGARYGVSSGIDSQHGFHRYHWTIHQGEKLLLEGFDVTEIDENGQVASVIGFFGKIPQNPPPMG